MKTILRRGGQNIELNALFIQPTRWCGLNCKGCYVKDHEGGEEGFHTPWNEQVSLFKQFYKGPHWANQITISVDDLHPDPTKQRHMLLVVDSILSMVNEDTRAKEDRPEVHMTLHTERTFQQYARAEIRHGWNKLDMLSFSTLPNTRKDVPTIFGVFKNRVPINYNYLVPEKWNAEWEITHLTEAALSADHIYLVMFKSPVGGPRNLPIRIGDRKAMGNYLLYSQEVVAKLPRYAREKIDTDGCMRDVVGHSRTGFGCSSNVSRFQVWPDGSVSGCAYSFTGYGQIGRTAEAIVANIRAGQERYDFRDLCHLPEVYSSIARST